jgi:hypothetical protein
MSVPEEVASSADSVFGTLLAPGYASHILSRAQCTTNTTEVSTGDMVGTTAGMTGKNRSRAPTVAGSPQRCTAHPLLNFN